MKRAAVISLLALSGCMSATEDGLPVISLTPGYHMVIRESDLTVGGSLADKSATVGIKIRWGKK